MESFIIKPSRIKTRKGHHTNVRSVRVHQNDPRRKTRAQSKRSWKKELRNWT